jgi:hypothetical protein
VDQTVVPVSVTNPVAIAVNNLPAYSQYGYSAWTTGPGVPCTKRTDIAAGYAGAPNAARLLTFFTMSDIHIADKESPAQPLYVALESGFGGLASSAYSPVILSTTHVLDAAVQTGYYMGVVLGSTPYGDIWGYGADTSFPQPPMVVADANRLMIIAAHVPINPGPDLGNNSVPSGQFFYTPYSVVTDTQLLSTLYQYPNLILWLSGHRHVNVITPQAGADAQHSFWEVETSSLRDFPQQFRTFDIRRNTDNTISIVATDVDPAATPSSPAGKSRGYAVGAARVFGVLAFTNTSPRVYNGELVKELTPAMQAVIATVGTPMQ